jgi:hypothetical protein
MQNFTPEDLIQYVYNETSPENSSAIKAALKKDFQLKETFDIIVSAQKSLETFQISPSEQSMDTILLHAKKVQTKFQTH